MSESRLTQLQRSISSAILIRTPGGTKEFDPTLCVWGGGGEREKERKRKEAPLLQHHAVHSCEKRSPEIHALQCTKDL